MRQTLLMALSTLTASWPAPEMPRTEAAAADQKQTESAFDEEFSQAADGALAREIDSLIARLGSPAYPQRQSATARLIEIGVPAFSQLRAAYQSGDDLEVRLRIEEIAHAAYLNYHVYDRNGFLGVSLSAYSPGRHQQVKVPEGTVAVVVMAVIKDTGAERAGLQRNDVIVGVNGKPFEGPWSQVVDRFAELIRSRRPGAVLELSVIRESEELHLEATVGRCPEEQIRGGRVRAIPELLRQANERFPAWWVEHFRSSTTHAPDEGEP